MTDRYQNYIRLMLRAAKSYPDNVIEATLIKYVCGNLSCSFCYKDEFAEYSALIDQPLFDAFIRINPPTNIEFIIDFFEALLAKDNKIENGIIFTPLYIADFISANVISTFSVNETLPSIIDPGCGCGIFLVSAATFLHNKTGLSYTEILNNAIFGIDLDRDNVRRCKIALALFVLQNGESNLSLDSNIICADSLKTNWNQEFHILGFDYVVGNPPYVNTHDMSKETALFLKKNFATTNKGVYNIFYAFIEQGMNFLKPTGRLGFIVPNNFLSIKSAEGLRSYIIEHQYLECVIDFSDNMVFKPVRTYSCILQLSKQPRIDFEYYVFNKADDIEKQLAHIEYEHMKTKALCSKGWKLVNRTTQENLRRIEGQSHSIRSLIKTGIATLRDEVFMVDFDGVSYYKLFNGIRYDIESSIVKRLYKIPDLKESSDINSKCRYIIFPYKKGRNGFEIMEENEIQHAAPSAYRYLLARKATLDERDKGKGNPVAWYAYGRTQGLNKYGNKLLFPTFAAHPRFTLVEDESALFCNGYAVFECDYLDFSLLARILNSKVMYYYVSNTSYSIEGGYYCYQKKYIENFTIPSFDAREIRFMKEMNSSQLDAFLQKKYGIAI